MSRTAPVVVLALVLLCLAGCGDDPEAELRVSWEFEQGDCATYGIETVRIQWGSPGGDHEDAEFDCAKDGGTLGMIDPDGATYEIVAEGLDSQGIVRARNLPQTLSFGAGHSSHRTIDVTLRPSPAEVLVTWSMSDGANCPPNTVMNYYVTRYFPPDEPGGELTDATEVVQASCSAGEVLLPHVPPGTWIIELDNRAISPAVYATREVEVEPGEDREVHIEF